MKHIFPCPCRFMEEEAICCGVGFKGDKPVALVIRRDGEVAWIEVGPVYCNRFIIKPPGLKEVHHEPKSEPETHHLAELERDGLCTFWIKNAGPEPPIDEVHIESP